MLVQASLAPEESSHEAKRGHGEVSPHPGQSPSSPKLKRAKSSEKEVCLFLDLTHLLLGFLSFNLEIFVLCYRV
jgi:hypothetical protein